MSKYGPDFVCGCYLNNRMPFTCPECGGNLRLVNECTFCDRRGYVERDCERCRAPVLAASPAGAHAHSAAGTPRQGSPNGKVGDSQSTVSRKDVRSH